MHPTSFPNVDIGHKIVPTRHLGLVGLGTPGIPEALLKLLRVQGRGIPLPLPLLLQGPRGFQAPAAPAGPLYASLSPLVGESGWLLVWASPHFQLPPPLPTTLVAVSSWALVFDLFPRESPQDLFAGASPVAVLESHPHVDCLPVG